MAGFIYSSGFWSCFFKGDFCTDSIPWESWPFFTATIFQWICWSFFSKHQRSKSKGVDVMFKTFHSFQFYFRWSICRSTWCQSWSSSFYTAIRFSTNIEPWLENSFPFPIGNRIGLDTSTPRKTNIDPQKMMVSNIWISFSRGLPIFRCHVSVQGCLNAGISTQLFPKMLHVGKV